MTPPQERLEVRSLSIVSTDGRSLVVDDVSFSVGAGEVCGLVGESGSGKTSTALGLLGYVRSGLKVSAGEVLIDGVDVLHAPAAALRRMRGAVVAYVPQDPTAALNPALRVGVQLRETLKAHTGSWGSSRSLDERLSDVVDDVGLGTVEGLLTAYPHQLSGGQQQRVAIAMAFACSPSLIVLDEPTTGLDVTTQRHVLETLRGLARKSGTAAVYVSHDLAVVGELADHLVVLYAGRIVEDGPTAEIFSGPAHPYTMGLLRAIPSPERAEVLEGIPGTPPRPDKRSSGCDFLPRCAFAEPAECATPVPLVMHGSDRHVRCVLAESISAEPSQRRVADAMAATEGDLLLEVSKLSASYTSRQVLNEVSFAVRPNECLAIVGESGSGKTTLARCLAGLMSSWTGSVTFDGSALSTSLRDRARDQLRTVQYIFQNPYMALNPRKTVGQIIEQPLRHFFPSLTRAECADRVDRVLEQVSLSPAVQERYPEQLSGGERQRVAIARSLVVEPRLLICDEVTSALDVSVQATTVELLRQLQSEHDLAIVFITHNLALVRSIAQRVLVLAAGEVVELGDTDAVLDDPQHPYTATLLNDAPKLSDALDPRPAAPVGGMSSVIAPAAGDMSDV